MSMILIVLDIIQWGIIMSDEISVLKEVEKQVLKAESKFDEFHSPHEGYGIIKEEFDELWDEIKLKSHDYKRMYEEALHVACTAIRFMKMCKLKDSEIR
jgi:hypothetical protein